MNPTTPPRIRVHPRPSVVELLCAFALLAAVTARASDWPQFLGPTRNGVYPGTNLAATWPNEGPPVLWQKPVGQGFSGPAVAQGRLILFHRRGGEEIVEALDARDGKPQWAFPYPTGHVDQYPSGDPGPRGTPAIADGRVFTFGAEGRLHCLDLATGAKVWSVDCKRQFGARPGFFGLACSPLVEGDAVLVNAGGTGGAGVLAFDKSTGRLLWKATDEEASYSSPVAATLGGKRLAVFLTRDHLRGFDVKTGKSAFEFPFMPPIQASVTAAAPLVAGDTVFITASYDLGAAALRVTPGGLERLWANDDALSSQYASVVERGGFLYGVHGRLDVGQSSLRCVELKSGKVQWSRDGQAYGTLILAGDSLLFLTVNGELIRAAASPDGYKELGRAQVLPFFARAHPALADGRLFARSKDRLFCVDLRAPETTKR
jgi:outer membrane protein assembly factor BamB